MSGKLRAHEKRREREKERARARTSRTARDGTRGVYDGVSVRRGDVARVSPPSRTPLLHATTIRQREGEEGGGHESDRDDNDGGGGGGSGVVLVPPVLVVVVVRDRVAPTRI